MKSVAASKPPLIFSHNQLPKSAILPPIHVAQLRGLIQSPQLRLVIEFHASWIAFPRAVLIDENALWRESVNQPHRFPIAPAPALIPDTMRSRTSLIAPPQSTARNASRIALGIMVAYSMTPLMRSSPA